MHYFIAFLFFTSSLIVSAQTEQIDNLYKELDSHPQQDTFRIDVLNELSVRTLKNRPEKSVSHSKEALQLATKIQFQRGIAESQLNLAVFQLMRGNVDEALALTLQALKISEKESDWKLESNCLAVLGTLYHEQMEYDKALHYLRDAQKLNRPMKNALIESKILNAMGSIARDKKKYDSALFFYQSALVVIKDGNEEYRLAEVLNNIGVTYQRMKQETLAIQYYRRALAAAERTVNLRAQGLALANIGYTYLSNKKYPEALELLSESLLLARQTGEKSVVSQSYIGLMQLHNELGEFNKAHAYMAAYYAFKDSLLNVAKTKQIADLEVRYETEKKELTILLLEQQRKNQELWTTVLMAALILLTAVSIVLYLFKHHNDNKNRQILNLEIDYLTSQQKELSEKLSQALMGQGKAIESLDQRTLKKAIEVVEQNLSDPLFGVERMGKEMGMSRTNLHRKMKAITGFPPSELIRSIRLRRAASMLMSRSNSVSQISFAVGFEDQSYFSKSFKKQFGVSPSEYFKSTVTVSATKDNKGTATVDASVEHCVPVE